MAAKEALEDLQQEVTCPLCLDTFDDPRVLSCQHTYCKKCLDSLVSRSRGATLCILCPECRKTTDASVGGVQSLPVAFKVNRLKELVTRMQREESASAFGTVATDGPRPVTLATPPSNVGDSSTCQFHPGQTLDMYCRQCNEIVCRDCILFDKTHSNHPYDKLDTIAGEDRKAIATKLRMLLQKQPSIKKSAADAKSTRISVEQCRKVMSTKVSESYDRLMSALEQKKQNELEQFHNVVDEKIKELDDYERSLTSLSSEMSAVESFVDKRLKNLGSSEFMRRKKGMAMKIDQVNARVNGLQLGQPTVELSPQILDKKSLEEIDPFCDRHLQTYTVIDPMQCTVTRHNNSLVKLGEVTIVSVTLKDSEGALCRLQQCVTVELSCARFGEIVSAKVVEQSSSHYEANLSPNLCTRGPCQLVAKVNGNIIGEKPIQVFIECPPRKLGEPVHIINDVQQPGCLKIINSRMFCRTAVGICFLDLENLNKPPVQSGIFPRDGNIDSWWPSEMAMHNGCLFVSDPRNGKVHKFKLDGQFLKSTLSDKSTLKTPNGLCVTPDGKLYVCDSDNHCIHIFNSDLIFQTTFGSEGSAPGSFKWPDNIAFDSSGNFYVTDYSNHRIQCFSSNFTLKWCTGTQGSGPGELSEPNVMHLTDDNKLYITDLSGVSVFDTNGQFITRFAGMCSASETKSSADGIIVDKDGFVFVSDTPRNRIVIF